MGALLATGLLLTVAVSAVIAEGPADTPVDKSTKPEIAPTPVIPTPSIAPGVRTQLVQQVPLAARPGGAPLLSPNVLYDINLAVPLFSQRDSAWSGNTMQTCGQSIGSAGCTLTSAAMVFKYYGAVNKDPGQLNSCMGNSACPWTWATGASSCSESKASWYNMYSFDYGLLIWALESDWPPMLEFTKSGSTHWVVVKGIYGNGTSDTDFRIADPWDGQVKTISSYTGSGYSKSRIAVYSKR